MIADSIEKLISLNIKMWHEITKIKNFDGSLKKDITISPKEHVKNALLVRKLNAKRSKVRWRIDKITGYGANETKINVYEEEE